MTPLAAVVDDDISVRESLESLIRSAGLEVRVFASVEEFLRSVQSRKADCLILDGSRELLRTREVGFTSDPT